MKLKGADGLTPDNIREEIDRGGRLVLYVYCVSIVVMTFKRGSSIHLVRAGQSRFTRGLPFTLTTLLFGWWGFPWGPIFSLECLFKNLRGGMDVTDEVLATFPARAGAVSNVPATFAPPAPRKPLTRRAVLVAASAVSAVLLLAYAAVCASLGELQVAVLNGTPDRATYTINGETVSVGPNTYKLIAFPQGEFRVAATPFQPSETLRLETPFWSRPFERKVAVLNPDRLAVFFRYHVVYKGERETRTQHDQPTDTAVYANQSHYLLPKPEAFFDEAPKSISMPSDLGFASRTRLALVPMQDPVERIATVKEHLGDDASQTYAFAVVRALPAREAALYAALNFVKPEAMLAFLEQHLDDRPANVEWHRAYHTLSQQLRPGVDLRPRYAALAAANPDDGAYHYLVGRLEPAPADAARHYARALAASQPCAFAHLGLAYIDANQARFADALAHYDMALSAGIDNESLRSARREMLFALRRHADLLEDIRRRRADAPLKLTLAAEEITCLLANGADLPAARKIEETTLGLLSKEVAPAELEPMRAYLAAAVAYGSGDETAFARHADKIGNPAYAFQAAIARRDHQAALLALKDAPLIPPDHRLMLHLVALQAGDAEAARTHWSEALKSLELSGGTRTLLARNLAGDAAPDLEQLHNASISPAQKAMIFTSLGLRYPERRAECHRIAAQFDFSPDFPHLLIASLLRKAPELSRL